MRETGLGVGVAAHHPRELAQPRVALHDRDAARGDASVVGLVHDEVPVGERRDLGEVGDDDDLGVLGEGGETAPRRRARPGRRLPRRPRRRRTWAATGPRRGLAEPTTSSASMTRDSSPPDAARATLRGVAPGLAASRISTSSMPCRESRTRCPSGSATPSGSVAAAELDVDDGLAHGQVGQLLGHPDAEVVGGRPARVGQRERRGHERASSSATSAPRRSTRSSAVTSSSSRGRAAPGPLEDLVDRLAVLPRQDAEGGPALLHVAESLGVEVDVLEVCREVGSEVRDEVPTSCNRSSSPARAWSWAVAGVSAPRADPMRSRTSEPARRHSRRR